MRFDELERELRAERPQPDPEFARRLDEWAAAGFPRDRGLGPRPEHGGAGGAFRRAWDRVTSIPPRRLLAPAGSLAVMAVIVAVAISQSDNLGGEVTPTAQQSDGGGGAAGAASEPGAAPAIEDSNAARERIAPDAVLAPPDGGGGIARGTDDRIVDATARVTLGAEADEVQEVANRVVEVSDRHDGVVLDSQVSTDQAGARAAFTLEIPFKQLDATLTDLSGLADVVSRTEAGEDITARAVRARKDLADTFEQVRRARIELIQADSTEERLIIRARIDSLQAQADAYEAELNNVNREGRVATVNVDVTSNGSADEGGWSLGDALDDASRVLEVIGGIALVGLAVLVPLSLVGAMAWLIATGARRHRRERALDS